MQINKNLIIWILVALLLILWWIYFKNNWSSVLDIDNSLSDTISSDTILSWDDTKWSENYKTLFVDACIEEWQLDDETWTWDDSAIDFVKYCNCVADRLETKYTIPQFLEKMDEDPNLNFMFDEIWECL